MEPLHIPRFLMVPRASIGQGVPLFLPGTKAAHSSKDAPGWAGVTLSLQVYFKDLFLCMSALFTCMSPCACGASGGQEGAQIP